LGGRLQSFEEAGREAEAVPGGGFLRVSRPILMTMMAESNTEARE